MRKLIIVALVALLAGLGLGAGRYVTGSSEKKAAQDGERTILYWVAPMDPSFRRDKPGKSPMDMDLIPVFAGAEQGAADAEVLRISAAVINNIGVRTDVTKVMDMAREIETMGFVTFNEDGASHVHVRTSGWVEKLYRKAVGERVTAGELILEFYSPELVTAQAEFVQAMRLGKDSLIHAATERLMALGMMEGQIATLRKTGKVKRLTEVRAHGSGVIVALEIGEGMHVQPGKTIFSIADLSTVWIQTDVFEAQSDWVAAGQRATMTLPYLPGETWVGRVQYVYPIVDPKSRTVRVRLVFPNDKGRLKPNMYGEITIEATPVRDVLSVPREALIRTGKTDRVILALGDGRFRPAQVIAGMESGGRIEIRSGLRPGEKIVTSGQFLIDSEASLAGTFLRMLDAGDQQ